jgi:Tol biopolymer transport system component
MKKINKGVFVIVIAFLSMILFRSAALSQQTAGELFEKALYIEEGQGDLLKAIGIYQDILKRFPGSRDVAAKAQLHIGLCFEKLGLTEAEKAYQKVIADYPDRLEEVKTAKEKLSVILKIQPGAGGVGKGPSVRLIWSGPEAESVGRVSPDGRFLSFVEQETANLCIKEIASGKTTVVTKKEPWGKSYEFALDSCWSPDGKKLVYGWFNKDNFIELRTADTDGSNVRVLYQQKNEMAFPAAWSPDGAAIAVGLASLAKNSYTSYSLGLVSVADGSLKILKTPNLLKTAPGKTVFSADGRFMIIDLPQSESDPKHDIFAISTDGREEKRIAEHPAADAVLGWIPGSNELLFMSDRTGTNDAWIVGFAAGETRGEPRLVWRDLGRAEPLGLSRDGSFFYRRGSEMTDIAIASIDLEKRALVEPPKTLSLPLIGASFQPQWSPDGKSLVFVSDRTGRPGGQTAQILQIRSTETGEIRTVTTNLRSIRRPCWSPDGRSVFIVGNDGKTFLAIYQIHVQTGQTTFLVDSEMGANIKFIAPAQDGKSVYYTYFEFAKKRCRIMGIDLATKETREIYRQDAPPDIGGLSVSPDGKNLVFGTLDPDASLVLKAIPLPGGPPREIVKSKAFPSGVSTAYFWSPDGKRILSFVDASKGKDKKSELWSVSFEGGEARSLGLTIDMIPTSVSLHPDGRRLAYAFSRAGTEVWIMENFMPGNGK